MQIPADIVCKCVCGSVAPYGFLAQRIQDNVIKVTAKSTLQAFHAYTAIGSNLFEFLQRQRIPVFQRIIPFLQQPAAGTRSFRLTDQQRDLARRSIVRFVGPVTREQAVQQQPQAIDVGSGRDIVSQHLFRGAVCGRHDDRAFPGQAIRRCAFGVAQFRNTKIQQLGRTVFGHQDVGRFDVTVNDQVLVRIVNSGTNCLEQSQPFINRQSVQIAIGVYAHPVDVLHDEVGNAVAGCAAVVKARDIGMFEVGEKLALVPQAKLGLRIDQTMAAQFYGDLLVKVLVRPLRKINHSHTTGAQQSLYAIRADHLPFHLLGMRVVIAKRNANGVDDRLLNVGFNRRIGLQQAVNVLAQFEVIDTS